MRVRFFSRRDFLDPSPRGNGLDEVRELAVVPAPKDTVTFDDDESEHRVLTRHFDLTNPEAPSMLIEVER